MVGRPGAVRQSGKPLERARAARTARAQGEEHATEQQGPAGRESGPGEPPLGGGDASKWDHPLTEDDAPWQSVWWLGGKFSSPGTRRAATGAERHAARHAELSRSPWEGLGRRAWHWGTAVGALAMLLLALRLVGGDGGTGAAATPEGWRAFAGSGYAGAAPRSWRHVSGSSLDYLVVERPTPPSPRAGAGARRLVEGSPAIAYPAVAIGDCRPPAGSRAEAQRRWAEELRAGGATLSVTRVVEVEGLEYQLLEVRAPAGATGAPVTQRVLPVGEDGCARELALTPIEGVVGVEEFAAVLATLRLGTE
jgi:hypothetical protein